ncbi:MAG: DUF4256 domain-containing protein [bacterium]
MGLSFKKSLSPALRRDFLVVLKKRFASNAPRHPGIEWSDVESRLEANAGKIWSLHEMEDSGGEPDVVGIDPSTGEFLFVDCSEQTPAGRTGVSYDRQALDSRQANKPANSALDLALAMGVELLTEHQYRSLQALGRFDTKTSSWLKTPETIRQLGGAIFGERRYGEVFIFHNGAQSYFGGRGFRGLLRV